MTEGRDGNPGESRRDLKRLALLYGLSSLIGFSILAGALALKGFSERAAVLEAGPLSSLSRTLLCAAMCWVLLGTLVLGLASGRVREDNWVPWGAFFVYAFLYLNIARERFAFGDVGDYVKAAANLRDGVPFHSRYIYPPLWATLLRPLLGLGERLELAIF